jgi:O-acetyl-ADP-ribose deacetylase (regulator of RNase III)
MSSFQISVRNCKIELLKGDITQIAVDAIVNAANSTLSGGGGVDGAIHQAGGPTLMRELRRFNGCPTGSAVITWAGRLPAKYVIHAVGPVYRGGDNGEPALLASCYRTALHLAGEHNCESISFPSISTGIYGYPMSDAAPIALKAIRESISSPGSPRVIKLVQFSQSGFDVYKELLNDWDARQTSAKTS